MSNEENIIFLFDESGRSILSPDSSHILLGVGILYKEEEEKQLFNTCNEPFNLSTSKPLKNENIDDDQLEKIIEKIAEIKIPITCTWVDLNDEKVIATITNCIALLGILKKYHHLQGSRKEAHFLHDRILDENIFDLLSKFLYDKNNTIIRIRPFLDNWSIPKREEKISLKSRSISIEQKIQGILNHFNQNVLFKIEKISLLKEPGDKRKRFIDIITSTVSRAFIKNDENKYVCDPSKIFSAKELIQFVDYTRGIIVHTNKITDDLLKDNPVI